MSFRVMPASREDSRPDPAAGWSADHLDLPEIQRPWDPNVWSAYVKSDLYSRPRNRTMAASPANRRVGNMPTLCDQHPMMPALRSKRVTHLAGTHLCTHAWTRFRQGERMQKPTTNNLY